MTYGRPGQIWLEVKAVDKWNFSEYQLVAEPGKRKRAYAWATAIGLQKVDGLHVSDYLLKTARRNIEGEISQDEAISLIDSYYETKSDSGEPGEQEEADKVSARINKVVSMPGFNLSPAYYRGLHKLIFDGVFPHAGKFREVELSKKEWVLNGDTVSYTPSVMISDTLDYDFERERKSSCAGLSNMDFVSHVSDFISGIWQIHPFREGNTRTVAVFTIKYLQNKGYDVTNALFEEHSWYFRNALVRANYQNHQLNIEKTMVPLEEFFRVLLFDEQFELKNRYLHISNDNSVNPFPSHSISDGVTNEVTNGVTNDDSRLLQLLKENPAFSYEDLARMLSVSRKTIAKRIRHLKECGFLIRVGSKVRGFWKVSTRN